MLADSQTFFHGQFPIYGIPSHNIPYSFEVISSLPFDVCKFTILPYGFRYTKNALMYLSM